MSALLADGRQLFLLTLALVRFVLVPGIRYLMGAPLSTPELAVRLRRFLDRSGLIYRKLGQYLAMRSDLLPHAICAELDSLFEAVTPMPFCEVDRQLKEELGPWRQYFAWIDPHPVGSASVAQVHRGMTRDGQPVAIKVQRRGIQKEFAASVRVFSAFASFFDLFRLTGTLYLRDLFDEFASFTRKELDFELEGRTAMRLRENMSQFGSVPAVRWDLTTPRLLTMAYIEGESFLTICRLTESGRTSEVKRILKGVDLHQVVSRLAEECFKQLFITGFFHGDPHPGNVILQEDGTFVFLDCGIAGELSQEQRDDLAGYVENLALGKLAASAHYYSRLCQLSPSTDVDSWMFDIIAALRSWYAGLTDPNAPIEARHMGGLQGKIAIAMRRHHVLNRPNQLLVWRALVLLDTTTLRLPTRLDLLNELGTFFRRRRGTLTKIVGSALHDFFVRGPLLAIDLISPVRLLLNPEAQLQITVTKSESSAGPSSRSGTRRMVCAVLGLACGVVAAGAWGTTITSLGSLASTALLLLALRK